MRNPWRFSIDDATGDIWVGDVGESTWESVYRIPAGQSGVNCGWPTFEGGHEVNFGAGAPVPRNGRLPPVHVYSHADVGPAVIGGYVYRGSAIPQLKRCLHLRRHDVADIRHGRRRCHADHRATQRAGDILRRGPNGELYVLTLRGGAYRLEPASAATPA